LLAEEHNDQMSIILVDAQLSITYIMIK